jgi:hypothetical protein
VNFDQAIMAHIRWKSRLKDFINRKEEIDPVVLGKDDQCELGKWIHGAARRDHGHRVAFADLKEKHAGFHTAASTVARRARSCAPDEALKMLDPRDSEFGKASSDCVNALTALRDEINRK